MGADKGWNAFGLQEAHPTEGFDQVRTDLIDQLLALTAGNISPDVAALLMGRVCHKIVVLGA